MHFPTGTKKNYKTLSWYSQFLDEDLKMGSVIHKEQVLTVQMKFLVTEKNERCGSHTTTPLYLATVRTSVYIIPNLFVTIICHRFLQIDIVYLITSTNYECLFKLLTTNNTILSVSQLESHDKEIHSTDKK
jgi:hypothetical protein